MSRQATCPVLMVGHDFSERVVHVPAIYVTDDLAVHHEIDGRNHDAPTPEWRITHVRSGMAVALGLRRRKDALALAERIAPELPWHFSPRALRRKSLIEARKRVYDAIAEAKAAA